MRSAFARGAAPLVVNLGGGDVTMAEQFLDFHDVDAGIEQERGSGGAQRARRVDAFHHFVAVRQFPFPKRVGELAQIFLFLLDQLTRDGKLAWAASFTAFGALESLKAEETSCPIRFQGHVSTLKCGLVCCRDSGE